MTFKSANMTASACQLWDRRNAALEASTALMNEKPDFDEWTEKERRLWVYAMAIGRRLEQLQ